MRVLIFTNFVPMRRFKATNLKPANLQTYAPTLTSSLNMLRFSLNLQAVSLGAQSTLKFL